MTGTGARARGAGGTPRDRRSAAASGRARRGPASAARHVSSATRRRRRRRRRGPRARDSERRPREPSGRPRRRARGHPSLTIATIPSPRRRAPSAACNTEPSRRARRDGRRSVSARGREHRPRHERQPDALDLALRHAAEVGESTTASDRHRRAATILRSRRPVDRDRDGGTGRDREQREIGNEEVCSTAGGSRRPSSIRGASRRTQRSTRTPSARTPRTRGWRRAPRAPSSRTRRRCAHTTTGTSASSTSPYDKNAVTPKPTPPASGQCVGAAAGASRREHDSGDRPRRHAREECVGASATRSPPERAP